MIQWWWRAARALRRRRGGDEGSAVIEFIFLGVLITLPVFYLVLTLARLQAGAYAVSAASRESGRTFVTAESESQAPGRARAAAAIAYADQGFAGQGAIDIECAAQPCLARDAQVRTRATLEVPLPFVPGFVSGVVPTSITVSAQHVETVDRFGAQP